jgi:hypothetical protein
MTRPPEEVHEEIAGMTPEQRGDLIRRVKGYDWPEQRKQSVIHFIMLLGLIGEKMPMSGKHRYAH